MTTLSAATQQYYDELLHRDTPKAAWGVIHCFFQQYSLAGAEEALWQLLGNTLTVDDLDNKHLSEERRSVLSFYEHSKALLYAIHTLLATTDADAVLFNPALNATLNTASANTGPTDKTILEAIITLIQPQAIYRLPPINDSEYLKLVIVIPDTANQYFQHYELILELLGMRYHNGFHYFLYCMQDLDKLITDGDAFYTSNCIAENNIYDVSAIPLPVVSAEQQAALTKKKIAGFTTTFGKALVFMEGARQFEEQERKVMAAYMLLECMVQAMRAMIQVFTGEDYQSHSIIELIDTVADYTPVLSEVFPENNEEEVELIVKLARLRYECMHTTGFTISNSLLTTYFDKGSQLLETARQAGREILQITTDTKAGNG